ncbi:MAG: hypothetical protein WEB93_01575, partial [Sphingomonadales bacterium]
MLTRINDVLDDARLAAIREVLSDRALFEDGARTAGRRAVRVKANLQGRPDHAVVRGVVRMVESALRDNQVFMAAACPQSLIRLLVSRYEPDMGY